MSRGIHNASALQVRSLYFFHTSPLASFADVTNNATTTPCMHSEAHPATFFCCSNRSLFNALCDEFSTTSACRRAATSGHGLV